MTEPDVTLTDYAITLECAVFVALLLRQGRPGALRTWFALFFAAIGAGALAGGTVHGFFLDPASTGQRLLWPATLLALGVAAIAAWAAGLRLQFPALPAWGAGVALGVAFLAYAALVLGGRQDFGLVIAFYLPAAVFLFGVLGLRWLRRRDRAAGLGLAGLGLTFVASAVQRAHIGIHPRFFNHNALYHLIQAVGLLLLFLCARALIGRSADRSHRAC